VLREFKYTNIPTTENTAIIAIFLTDRDFCFLTDEEREDEE
jgi:hypothetical protein